MSSYELSRREFLKLSGLGATAALISGCTANLQKTVWMEPYVTPPEETLPGEDFWFASTCRMCPAGCGIVVRTSNGRARKIEGNASHPLNQGKLCARGQAGLQLLYHPDRLTQVLKRTGERGSKQWGTTSWEQIVDEIAAELANMSSERVAFLTGRLPDYQAMLVSRFMDGLGGEKPIVYDAQSVLDGYVLLQAATQAMFDDKRLPVFDIAQADVVFGFGANFLETWLSPVAYGLAYGAMRSQSGIRGTMVSFEPRMSMTAANSDRWIPVPAGYEGLVALALGKIIVDERLGHDGVADKYRALYKKADVGAIAEQSGISVEQLRKLAHLFATAHHPIAVPGGVLAGQLNGLDAIKAVTALNLIVGHTGDHGAIFLSPAPPSRDLMQFSPSSFSEMINLIERMKAGKVDVLFVLGANPVYEIPEVLGFVDGLAKVKRVISFAVIPDETTAVSDIVLPAHTYLETWGYELPNPGKQQLIVSAQQPIVRPLYDTRDPGDVLLALADKLGGQVARRLPWPNLVTFIQTRLTSLQILSGNITANDAETFWIHWLQSGGWWSQDTVWESPNPTESFLNTPLQVNEPTFDGDAEKFPLQLLPVASVAFGDGRHASLPWLQEMPDPTTTVSWDTWVEINPQTAASLDIQDSDIVKIRSPYGEIEAVAYLYPGIHPNVIAVPVGQGHTELGRWAQNRGANVWRILSPQTEPETGQLAWAATRVKVEATTKRRLLPRLESNIGVDRAREKGHLPG
ncbi:MAG: hypothetical protein D6706_07325 [Chloroflexi bacterium]|nr:MAG: hypothetical protein D6706_07325 [Chloroflexota bacterium]